VSTIEPPASAPPSTSPPPSTSARRIGRYAVQGVIGTGAFASVYRAFDERLDATVAIKLLADNHCLDPDVRARFIDEGCALRRIDSPHVVRVYDVGETDQMQPYLVLEHADRGTLAARVAARRAAGWRPGADDLRLVVAQLADAVDAVHAAQLVHRDLSPGNVLLRSSSSPGPGSALVGADERLVLSDLGLSKDLARSSGLTVAGGTEGFRPPEQRGGPARVDGRADLWALSAVVVWLLTGAAPDVDRPVDKRGLTAALAALDLPEALRAPLLRGLADDPAQRQPDVAAWRTEVEAALAGPSANRPASPAGSSSGSGSGSAARRPRPVVWVLAAVALVGIGLGLGWALPDGGDGSTTTRLDDGRVRVTDRAGGSRLSLTGPADAEVGDTVTFEATAEGLDHWAWLMPDGTVAADEDRVQLHTSSAGVAELVLVGVAESGEQLEVRHRLQSTG
jgi:hypothetical protein